MLAQRLGSRATLGCCHNLKSRKEPLCDGAWAGSRWWASRLPMLAQRHEELCYEACCAVALAFAFLMSCANRDLVRAAALG